MKGKAGALIGKETSENLDLLRVGPPKKSEPLNSVTVDKSNIDLVTILDQHADVFLGIGKLKNFQLKLHVNPDITPVQQPICRIPFHTRKKVEVELERLQRLDIIEPVTGPTSWVNPIVPVPKSNDRIRLCLDMRRANEAIIRERHIIPKVEHIVSELHGAKFFSKFDLREGYHQIELHPDSRDITTFATHKGLYRYKRLIYGVSSAFESFQKQVESVIAGCEGVRNISDDILVWAETEEQHNQRLNEVLSRLSNAGLKVNKEKCIFKADHLPFAGHELSADGVSPQKSRIEAITNMPHPTSATGARSFLGMINFCKQYIRDYSSITAPLRLLTKKCQRFFWGPEHQKAFDTLQDQLISAEVMAFYNPDPYTAIKVYPSSVKIQSPSGATYVRNKAHLKLYVSSKEEKEKQCIPKGKEPGSTFFLSSPMQCTLPLEPAVAYPEPPQIEPQNIAQPTVAYPEPPQIEPQNIAQPTVDVLVPVVVDPEPLQIELQDIVQQTVDVLGPVEEPLSPVSTVAYGLDSDPEELSDSEQTILYEQPQMLSQSQRPKRTIRKPARYRN